MAIVYTVDDIRILTWEVQIARERVRVVYAELLDTDERWDVKEAFFWASLPTEGPGGPSDPVPENWYQLPVEYVSILTDLTIDARNALLPTIGE